MAQDFNRNQPPYQFVIGNGDAEHQTRVNNLAATGYKIISTVFDPDASSRGNQRLIVVMGLTL